MDERLCWWWGIGGCNESGMGDGGLLLGMGNCNGGGDCNGGGGCDDGGWLK